MSAGQQVLDFLYTTQLQIDDEWAVRTPNGFTWWAAENAQTVEIIGEETAPDGTSAALVSVRTEMLSDLELTDAAAAELNDTAMRHASMSGPVYDPDTGSVSLCSLVRVHDDVMPWVGMVLSTAAVLQLAEVNFYGQELAEHHNAFTMISGHPDRGVRLEPDEMTFAAIQVFNNPANREPLLLQESDFDDAVREFMMRPPSRGASAGGLGLTVEFPYGDATSLCQLVGEQDHPLWGNGLLILQHFPYEVPDETAAIRLALEFNREDLTRYPAGYGLGSYVYADGMLCYTSFLPNLLLREGVLPNLYFSCAERALSMAVRLLDY